MPYLLLRAIKRLSRDSICKQLHQWYPLCPQARLLAQLVESPKSGICGLTVAIGHT